MKKIILLFALLPIFANAQLGGKNIIKANLSSLALGNYHVTYERAFLKKMSLSVSYRSMPKKVLPVNVKSVLDNYVSTTDFDFGNFYMGNTAITPELRIYIGAGKMKGFYVAPYVRLATFDITIPVKYTSSALPGSPSKYSNFEGKITSTSGGLMIGTQHQIFKKLVLDIWVLGGHYGTSSGDLASNNINPALTAYEQQTLQKTLDDNKTIGPFTFEGKVAADGKSATIKSTGPWAGVRALGFSLGFRF